MIIKNYQKKTIGYVKLLLTITLSSYCLKSQCIQHYYYKIDLFFGNLLKILIYAFGSWAPQTLKVWLLNGTSKLLKRPDLILQFCFHVVCH